MHVPLQESSKPYEACAIGGQLGGEDEAACDGDATDLHAKCSPRRWIPGGLLCLSLAAAAALALAAALLLGGGGAPERFRPTARQAHWVSEEELRKVEDALVRMEAERQRNFTVVAVFSKELRSMASNLFCSLAARVEDLSRVAVLALAMDGDCEGIDLGTLSASTAAECLPVELAPPTPKAEHEGEVSYQTARYIFFCRVKLALFSAIMDASLAHDMQEYKWFLFSDVDVAIKGDVFAYFVEDWVKSADLKRFERLPGSYAPPGEPLGVFQQNTCDRLDPNTGFYFLRASGEGSRLLNGALHGMMEGKTFDHADQGAIQRYLKDLDEAHRRHFYLFPCSHFPTGKDYFEAYHSFPSAVALHANWIEKKSTKVQCLKTTGDWFLTTGGKCLDPGSRWPWHAAESDKGRIQGCFPGPSSTTTTTTTTTTTSTTTRTTTTKTKTTTTRTTTTRTTTNTIVLMYVQQRIEAAKLAAARHSR